MKGYSESYFDLIYKNLKEMKVTVDNGKEITKDEGFDIWAERARDVQQNTRTYFFLRKWRQRQYGRAHVS